MPLLVIGSSPLHAAMRQSCLQKHTSDHHPTGCLRTPASFASLRLDSLRLHETVEAGVHIALPPLTSSVNHVSKFSLSQDSRSKLYVNDTVYISAINRRGELEKS